MVASNVVERAIVSALVAIAIEDEFYCVTSKKTAVTSGSTVSSTRGKKFTLQAAPRTRKSKLLTTPAENRTILASRISTQRSSPSPILDFADKKPFLPLFGTDLIIECQYKQRRLWDHSDIPSIMVTLPTPHEKEAFLFPKTNEQNSTDLSLVVNLVEAKEEEEEESINPIFEHRHIVPVPEGIVHEVFSVPPAESCSSDFVSDYMEMRSESVESVLEVCLGTFSEDSSTFEINDKVPMPEVGHRIFAVPLKSYDEELVEYEVCVGVFHFQDFSLDSLLEYAKPSSALAKKMRHNVFAVPSMLQRLVRNVDTQTECNSLKSPLFSRSRNAKVSSQVTAASVEQEYSFSTPFRPAKQNLYMGPKLRPKLRPKTPPCVRVKQDAMSRKVQQTSSISNMPRGTAELKESTSSNATSSSSEESFLEDNENLMSKMSVETYILDSVMTRSDTDSVSSRHTYRKHPSLSAANSSTAASEPRSSNSSVGYSLNKFDTLTSTPKQSMKRLSTTTNSARKLLKIDSDASGNNFVQVYQVGFDPVMPSVRLPFSNALCRLRNDYASSEESIAQSQPFEKKRSKATSLHKKTSKKRSNATSASSVKSLSDSSMESKKITVECKSRRGSKSKSSTSLVLSEQSSGNSLKINFSFTHKNKKDSRESSVPSKFPVLVLKDDIHSSSSAPSLKSSPSQEEENQPPHPSVRFSPHVTQRRCSSAPPRKPCLKSSNLSTRYRSKERSPGGSIRSQDSRGSEHMYAVDSPLECRPPPPTPVSSQKSFSSKLSEPASTSVASPTTSNTSQNQPADTQCGAEISPAYQQYLKVSPLIFISGIIEC